MIQSYQKVTDVKHNWWHANVESCTTEVKEITSSYAVLHWWLLIGEKKKKAKIQQRLDE